MNDRTMDRIRDEMAAHAGDGMTETIGEHLTEYLRMCPDAEFKEDATIALAIGSMQAKAQKQAGGRMAAALDYLTGMKIVYDTFGLPWDKKTCVAVQMSLFDKTAPEPTPPKKETKAPADEFDLDALLGGDGL